MSIAVTCPDCDASYKLADRYAEKRVRCKACKARIRVPAADAAKARKPVGATVGAEDAKASKPKRTKSRATKSRAPKPQPAKSSKAKRKSKTSKPKASKSKASKSKASKKDLPELRELSRRGSESIHQLSPLNSGERLDTYPTRRKRKKRAKRAEGAETRTKTKGKVKPAKGKAKAKPAKGKAKSAKGKAKSAKPAKGKAKTKPAKGAKATKGKAKSAEPAKGKAKPAKGAKATKGKAKTKGAKAKAKPAKGAKGAKGTLARAKTAKLGRAPLRDRKKARNRANLNKARKIAARGRRGRDVELDSDAEIAPAKNATRTPLLAALALAGLLCLGIGLVVGGVFGDKTPGLDVDKKLTFLTGLKQNRQWDVAQKEADQLEATLKQAEDTDSLSRLYKLRAGIDKMVAIQAAGDDQTRLLGLLKYADDRDPALRLGIAMELRKLVVVEEAQTALLRLCKDGDAKVAAAAKQGMVQAGGLLAVPYLLEAIKDTASTGGKLGDVAIERALELSEPEVVPVLVAILETRSKAPADMLEATLKRLADFGEGPDVVKAAEAYLKHESEAVQKAAKLVVDSASS